MDRGGNHQEGFAARSRLRNWGRRNGVNERRGLGVVGVGREGGRGGANALSLELLEVAGDDRIDCDDSRAMMMKTVLRRRR
jgi:hypothetical protein